MLKFRRANPEAGNVSLVQFVEFHQGQLRKALEIRRRHGLSGNLYGA
jgi:hypothetical protein